MPILQSMAQLLSNNELVAGVIEEIIDVDDLFHVLPFTGITGKAYVYNRENTLSEADFLSPNDTVNEGAADYTEVTTTLKILAGDVDVDKFLDTTYNDTNNVKALQIAAKAKGLARAFRRNLIQGDSAANAKSFDGIGKIVDPTQVIAAGANGAAMTFGMLDQLVDQVPLGPDVLIMRKSAVRAFRALLRSSGGIQPQMTMDSNFGKPMLQHNGIPVIVDEFITGDETMGTATATTSVYAVRLNEVDGLHGLYGGPNAGIVVEDIGTVQNKDATRTRVKWYVGLALKGTKSLARLQGLTNV